MTIEERDAAHLQAIVRADEAVEGAKEKLRLAVASAREDGISWTMIGGYLGMTRQAARQRFGRPPRGRSRFGSPSRSQPSASRSTTPGGSSRPRPS